MASMRSDRQSILQLDDGRATRKGMGDRHAGLIRIVAGLCLVALIGSWAPHSHADPTARTALSSEGSDTLSADDAHEEHSSRSLIEQPPCVFCRSKGDRKFVRTSDRMPSVLTGSASRSDLGIPDRFPEPIAHRLPPTRAPPIPRTS